MKKKNEELSEKIGEAPFQMKEVRAFDEEEEKKIIEEGIKVGGKVQVTLHCDQVS